MNLVFCYASETGPVPIKMKKTGTRVVPCSDLLFVFTMTFHGWHNRNMLREGTIQRLKLVERSWPLTK
jgi:hypothetical protein